MIGRIRGIILEKQPLLVLLETNGVSYELHMPMTCFYALPETGNEAVILTHFMVRKDAQLLFGFIHKQERMLFRELIKVNGVGPKLALAILSGMSAQQFMLAVEHKEINKLVKLPSVGKKIAERLVIEMKDRFKGLSGLGIGDFAPSANEQRHQLVDSESEAVAALVALGYKSQEAGRMVRKVAYTGADCEVLIRDALRAAM